MSPYARRSTWLWFRVADGDYVTPLDTVSEIVPARTVHLIPLVRPDAAGVLNTRGEPLPVVYGAGLLANLPRALARYALVFESCEGRIGLIVDSVLRIDRDFDPASLGEVDDDEERSVGACAAWRRTPDGEKVGVVDVDALMRRATDLLKGQCVPIKEEQCHNAF